MDTIVLCHGFPGFDRIGPVDYFKGVKTHLELTCRDIRVLTPDVSAFGTIKTRAEELARFLSRDTKGEKVHIIAHSAGGLDARKLVSKGGLGESERVATITTISTPHEGTRLAEIALGEFRPTLLEGWKLFSRFRELFSRVSVPATEEALLLIENLVKNPFKLLSTLKKFEELLPGAIKKLLINALAEGASGLRNLTRAAMIEFNQSTPDAVGEVKYFYHAGIVQPESLTPVFYLPSVVVSALEDTSNDGWISFSSANRDDSAMQISADHLQAIGHGISGFDHLKFYTEIVKKVTGKNCTPP